MASSRIRTPLKQHWFRFRVGALPVVSFVACVAFMFFLWQRQAHQGGFVGEVEAVSVDVTSDIAGELTFPGDTFWQIYDTVNKGQPIARLDDRPTLARLNTVKAEISRLEADLTAATTNLSNDHLALDQRHAQEKLRLLLEVESRKVQELQLTASIVTDIADLRAIEDDLKILEGMKAALISQARLFDLRRQRDVVRSRIIQNNKVLATVVEQHKAAQKRHEEFADIVLPNVETVLKPIRAGITVQESLIKEIDIELESLTIEAPIEGVISAIWHRPGERIVAGERIVTIARRGSQMVVSYFREQHGIEPYKGMKVGLRHRELGSREYDGTVEHVGPHVEPVPPHQLKDQAAPEWATPVRIAIPDDMLRDGVRPGQLLNVILKESRRGRRTDSAP